MSRRGEASTLVQEVYDKLRREVLRGQLRPGQKLQPGELRLRFHVSLGVMREALTRLAESHLVAVTPNQGFSVVELSAAEIIDITRVRSCVEGLALRVSSERGGLRWESEVLAAHHRLANTPAVAPEDPLTVTEDWAEAHSAFHRALIGACGIPALLGMCDALSDAMTLYRHSKGGPGADDERDFAGEHRSIVDALLARDTELAVTRLAEHLESTARRVLRHSDAPSSTSARRE